MDAFSLFELFFTLLSVVFIGLLLYLMVGISRSPSMGTPLNQFTILIPIKNEAERLPSLIRQLRELLISHPEVKVKLINDHSTDLGKEFISKLDLDDQISLHNASENIFGKKAVLNEAIKKVSDSWVLFMDADTVLHSSFFDNLNLLQSEREKCILIPLSPIKRTGIVPAFFDLDFLSLHYAGLKSAVLGRPLLANGACMFINRKAYLESLPLRNDWNQVSGDDVFAMFAIAKKYGRRSVSAFINLKFPVLVDFPSQFKSLWVQRIRWIGKTGTINNGWFQFVAITVLLMQVFLIGAAIFITQSAFGAIGVVSFFLVLIVEIAFLAVATKELNRIDLWIYIVPSVFIYPFYLLTLVIFSTFAKPKWK